jgi:hypothetical protein
VSPEDISPARGLGRSTQASVLLTDDPTRLRPTKSSFRANSASVRADTATPGFSSSKSSRGVPLTKQEKPRTTRPTEPRDSYASGIRIPHHHLCTGRLTLGEAVQTTNRRVLVLENEEKHGSAPKIHTCSGPDSHNEQKTGIQGAITNGTPVLPPQVRTTPLDGEGACGATEDRRTTRRHPLQQQRRRRLLLRGAEQQQR